MIACDFVLLYMLSSCILELVQVFFTVDSKTRYNLFTVHRNSLIGSMSVWKNSDFVKIFVASKLRRVFGQVFGRDLRQVLTQNGEW